MHTVSLQSIVNNNPLCSLGQQTAKAMCQHEKYLFCLFVFTFLYKKEQTIRLNMHNLSPVDEM